MLDSEHLENLLAEIAPRDLGEYPLYIGVTSRLPDELRGMTEGYTARWLHLLLREHLPDRGPGAAMVLNDLGIEAGIRKLCPGLSAEKVQQFVGKGLVATAMHEAAHILTFDTPFLTLSDLPAPATAREFHSALCEQTTQEKKADRIDPDVGAHGLEFTRVAIHVVERAGRIGVEVPLPAVCGGQYYGMRDAIFYRQALLQELDWLRDASFAEIRATPVPSCFQALYEHDKSVFPNPR